MKLETRFVLGILEAMEKRVMTNAVRWPLGVLAAGGLAACAGGVVSPTNVGGSYDPLTLNYVASKGDLYTQVVGNPFTTSKGKLDSVVTGTMFGAHFGPPIRFSTERDPQNRSPYHVVVLFNPQRPVTARTLCENPQQPTAASEGTVRVMMAFCSADYYETSVSGRLAGVDDPNDPAFRTFIRQMTAQLLPPRNPDPNGGSGDFNT
ncbi:MAG: hypothetical protein ACE5GS_11800 [Kiloniellaceae bacterium]